jgi:hypothetical protein
MGGGMIVNDVSLLWDQFSDVNSSDLNTIAALQLIDGGGKGAYLGKDASGNRYVLAPQVNGKDFRDDRRRAFHAESKWLEISGRSQGYYFYVKCVDGNFFELFNLFCSEFIRRLSRSYGDPADVLRKTFLVWKDAWVSKEGSISDERIAGLFGELWFLANYLGPCLGYERAINSWAGPEGHIHDFAGVNGSVEVKTCTANRRVVHKISGLEQLVPLQSTHLLFFSLHIRNDPSSKNNIKTLIDHIGDKIDFENGDKSFFVSQLEKQNIFWPEFVPGDDRTFSIRRERIYAVSGSFPRITPNDISMSREGVVKVDYEIDLTDFDECILSYGNEYETLKEIFG